MRRRLSSVAITGLVACSGIVDVERRNPNPLVPLPAYAAWWSATGACAGRSGDMERIEW